MQINFAHIRESAAAGGWIDFAVFEADARSHSPTARSEALASLTAKARAAGHKVDQSALAFQENGRLTFFGTKTLVDYLSRGNLPRWTHTLSV